MEGSQTRERLTPREEEVLDHLRRGLTDAQIAERLGISRSAVSKHVSEIIGKLGVRNRHEAAYFPERPPWWLALMPPFLRPRVGPAMTGFAVVAFAVVLAALGFLAFLLAREGDDDDRPSNAVVNGTLRLPQGAITALDGFAFTTRLDATAADGDYGLQFEGTFRKPDMLQGTLTLEGRFLDIYKSYPKEYQRPQEFETVAIGTHVWWRESGGDWQPGVEEGYEQSDPIVGFRQYATPFFYLEALRFDELDLPVAGPTEQINGVRAIPVRLDRQALIDVIAQGTGRKAYPEDEEYSDYVPVQNAQEVLPRNFNIDVWFEEKDLYPTRIVFDYSINGDDSGALEFGFSAPMTLRLQMDITDPDANVDIEPIDPIPTFTPTPTTVPGQFETGQEGAVAETAISAPFVGQLFDLSSGGGSVGMPVFVWRTSDLRVLGGAALATFNQPVDFEGDWPSIVYDESLDPPFTEVTHRYRVEGVTQLRILVYLPELRVVDVRPVDGTIVSGTPPPLLDIPGGPPAGAPDSVPAVTAPPPEN